MDRISVLIADDHAPFRDGLRALLRSEADIETVGEAATGREVIAQAATLQPDVILMDLHMPEGNGIDASRTILASSPHISILVLTMFEDDDSVFAALQAGARGYLLKGALKAEILRAIRGVYQGEAIFGPTIASENRKFLPSSRSTWPIRKSPSASSSARRRYGTTSRISSANCRWLHAHKPSCERGKRVGVRTIAECASLDFLPSRIKFKRLYPVQQPDSQLPGHIV